MKKIMHWVLAAILICGASVFTACTNDTSDNPAQEQAKKNRKEFVEHTRATMKDLAENLNFGSWTAANTLNLYFTNTYSTTLSSTRRSSTPSCRRCSRA